LSAVQEEDCSVRQRPFASGRGLLTSGRTETETVIHSDNDFAIVAFLRVKNAILEEKNVPSADAPAPPLLEEDLVELEKAIEAVDVLASENGTSGQSDAPESHLLPQASKHRCWVVIGGVECPMGGNSQADIEDEVRACFRRVKGRYSLILETSRAQTLI
jgi:diphthine-ammonia ligase